MEGTVIALGKFLEQYRKVRRALEMIMTSPVEETLAKA